MRLLKINEQFSIRKDSNNWILVEKTAGKAQGRQRYFGTLTSLVSFTLELMPDPSGDMAQLQKSLGEAHRSLSKMIREHSQLVKGKL